MSLKITRFACFVGVLLLTGPAHGADGHLSGAPIPVAGVLVLWGLALLVVATRWAGTKRPEQLKRS